MINHLINLFFPKTCAGCNTFLLAEEQVLCTTCRHDIPMTYHYFQPENEMIQKFYGRIPVQQAAALFYFHKEGIAQEMMHKLKYQGHEEIGELIGNWFGSLLLEQPQWLQADVVIPVPLHPKKRRLRGYNQVSAFGKALSKTLEIPYSEELLHRVVYSNSQTKKGLLSRSEMTQNTFEITFTPDLVGTHFLLLDDVITTGSTLESCSRALLQIPEAKVSILCMAMAHS